MTVWMYLINEWVTLLLCYYDDFSLLCITSCERGFCWVTFTTINTLLARSFHNDEIRHPRVENIVNILSIYQVIFRMGSFAFAPSKTGTFSQAAGTHGWHQDRIIIYWFLDNTLHNTPELVSCWYPQYQRSSINAYFTVTRIPFYHIPLSESRQLSP